MVAAHEEMVMPRVMTAIEDLVAREASGVLEVTGNPSGAIYLDAGRIAFARASWVPGLVPRLHAACPALADAGELLPSSGDADDAAVAGLAVQHGYLTPARLHELIRVYRRRRLPGAGDPAGGGLLRPRHPLHLDPHLLDRACSPGSPWTRSARKPSGRAERMTEHGLAPTTPVGCATSGAVARC